MYLPHRGSPGLPSRPSAGHPAKRPPYLRACVFLDRSLSGSGAPIGAGGCHPHERRRKIRHPAHFSIGHRAARLSRRRPVGQRGACAAHRAGQKRRFAGGFPHGFFPESGQEQAGIQLALQGKAAPARRTSPAARARAPERAGRRSSVTGSSSDGLGDRGYHKAREGGSAGASLRRPGAVPGIRPGTRPIRRRRAGSGGSCGTGSSGK